VPKKLAFRKFFGVREERRVEMTKKHYKEVAKIISAHTSKSGDMVHKQRLVEELSAFFKADNPRFDMERFTTACK